MRTVAVLVALLAATACADGRDQSDVVRWDGRTYVVMWSCPTVEGALLREPESAVLDPAPHGAEDVEVSAARIDGLDPQDLIAVEGPAAAVCRDGDRPGVGVAYSSGLGHAQAERMLGEVTGR